MACQEAWAAWEIWDIKKYKLKTPSKEGVLLGIAMVDEDLRKAAEKIVEQRIAPIREKMLADEKSRHDKALDEITKGWPILEEKSEKFVAQVISLEGVMFGAVVIFTNTQNITVFLLFALISMIISMAFGVWSQDIAIKAKQWSIQFDWDNEMKRNWMFRESWKDKSIEFEKQLCKSSTDLMMKKPEYKLLKMFFILSLILLVIHFLSKPNIIFPSSIK